MELRPYYALSVTKIYSKNKKDISEKCRVTRPVVGQHHELIEHGDKTFTFYVRTGSTQLPDSNRLFHNIE